MSIGDHTGGKLWTAERIESLSMLKRSEHRGPGVIDCHNTWQLFNGCAEHETTPFKGTRISFIAFTNNFYYELKAFFFLVREREEREREREERESSPGASVFAAQRAEDSHTMAPRLRSLRPSHALRRLATPGFVHTATLRPQAKVAKDLANLGFTAADAMPAEDEAYMKSGRLGYMADGDASVLKKFKQQRQASARARHLWFRPSWFGAASEPLPTPLPSFRHL